MKSELEARVAAIEARNRRVEADKAWEGSWTRASILILLTYVIVVIFFEATQQNAPFINALEPCAGIVLSTITAERIKNIWVKRRLQK